MLATVFPNCAANAIAAAAPPAAGRELSASKLNGAAEPLPPLPPLPSPSAPPLQPVQATDVANSTEPKIALRMVTSAGFFIGY